MKRLFISIAVAISTISAMACTNFIVGKNASLDGSTMISYAADAYSFYGYLHFREAADHQPGDMRQIVNWDDGKPLLSIPEIPHTYRVIGNMNEHQVTIGETTWGGQDLSDTVGIDYGSLIYIALERSKTAREAIECITNLAAEYGYVSGGESFSIGYETQAPWLRKIGASSMTLRAYMNDLFNISSIKEERGIDYPFARSVSFSLGLRF